MKNDKGIMNSAAWLFLLVAAVLGMDALCPPQALAQVPARFYWKSLAGGNAVPLIYESMSGNTNPFDSSLTITPGGKLDATLTLAGYAKVIPVGDRAAMVAIILPMGRVAGEVTVAGTTFQEATNGFGDPMLEFNINVLGPRVQKNIPDILRYEPGVSVDLLADLALPVGEYDDTKALNLGQNRWYGRLGAPIIWQLGPWVPGRRTTLELLPAVWIFGANDDFVGHTLKTDPMFQLDAHLTRDFTEYFWGALDGTWYKGGGSSIDGQSAGDLNNIGMGFTLGYHINDNLQATFGYKSTLNDSSPDELRMDQFMVSLVYGWHPLIEGSRRLKGGE
jgi:hypothetical protein